MPDVVAVHRSRGEALLSDDSIAPIRTWIDPDGEECEAPDAVVAIAETVGGQWVSIDLRGFVRMAAH